MTWLVIGVALVGLLGLLAAVVVLCALALAGEVDKREEEEWRRRGEGL